MSWTKKSYNALFDWIQVEKKESIRKILIKDGLNNIVTRLDNANNLGEWYKITREAAEAVGEKIIESSAKQAESELNQMAAALGRKGGLATSPAKTEANRAKSNLPPKPGKNPRGRQPKKKPEVS